MKLHLVVISLYVSLMDGYTVIDQRRHKRSNADGCMLSTDRETLQCADVKFLGQHFSARVKMDGACDELVSIKLNIVIEALGLNFVRDVDHSQKIAVPGFEYNLGGLAKAGVYVVVNLHKSDHDHIKLLMTLKAEVIEGNIPIKIPDVAMFDGKMQVHKCNSGGGFAWNRLKIGEKVGLIAGIIVGATTLLILIVSIIRYIKRSQSMKLPRTRTNSLSKNKVNNTMNNNPRMGLLNNVQSYENKQYIAEQSNILSKDVHRSVTKV